MQKYRDRQEAGERLAEKLTAFKEQKDVVVLGLPRGGVPVAARVARALDAPLGIFVVRKLGVPGNEEYAMGAIASGGVRLMNEDVVRSLGITEEQIKQVVEREERKLRQREDAYRGQCPQPELKGKLLILVDDGIATGATVRVAIKALREYRPRKVVVAVPVAPPETCQDLSREVDEVVCPLQPSPLRAISLWYEDFSATTDEEVRRILAEVGSL
jgi:putative phosphoribosyl transferase